MVFRSPVIMIIRLKIRRFYAQFTFAFKVYATIIDSFFLANQRRPCNVVHVYKRRLSPIEVREIFDEIHFIRRPADARRTLQNVQVLRK